MWILHFLPDALILWICNIVLLAGILLTTVADALILWICNIVLLAGILLTTVAFFIKRIPVINQYRIPAQVLGIALLVVGVYWRGGYAIEQEWRERVAAVEAQVAAAEAASREENTKIVTKVVTKTQIIRTRGETITKYIDREIVKYDTKFAPGGQCEIPQEFIKVINDAAEAPK